MQDHNYGVCAILSSIRVTGTFSNGSARTFKSVAGKIVHGLAFENGAVKWFPDLQIHPFHSGLSSVFDLKTRSFGYMNHQGEMVVPPQYLSGTDFSEGRAIVFDGYEVLLLDEQCSVIRSFDGSLMTMDEFRDGIMRVSTFHSNTCEKRVDGFIDRDGEFILPIQYPAPITVPSIYDRDDYYSNGLMRIWENGKYGFINKWGDEVIPAEYSKASCFWGETAAMEYEGKIGYINKLNDRLFADKVEDIQGFSEGLAAFKKDGLWGFMNIHGECVIEPLFIGVGYFKNGLAPVRIQKGMGITSKEMHVIVPPHYESIEIMDDGIFKIVKNGREGLLDLHGDEILSIKTALQEFSENN